MASRPCVQRRGIYCSHLTRWNGSLILLFGSFISPFGSPAGRHSKGNGPAGIPWQQSGTQPSPWQLRVHARMLVCVR